jgi:hypothetical protein
MVLLELLVLLEILILLEMDPYFHFFQGTIYTFPKP